MQHILIVGPRGVGKSTLIRALLQALHLPIDGIITKKEAPLSDGFSPVYIHRYGTERQFGPGNCIGLCRDGHSIAFPESFERVSAFMPFPSDHVIVFDELGFLESDAPRFTEAVLRTLDEAPLVIAAVRDKATPFLNAVRSHPKAAVYRISEENRDELREMLVGKLTGLSL